MNKSYYQNPIIYGINDMQLELKPGAITVNANMRHGVLTTKTFEGPDCYTRMLNFIKRIMLILSMQPSLLNNHRQRIRSRIQIDTP